MENIDIIFRRFTSLLIMLVVSLHLSGQVINQITFDVTNESCNGKKDGAIDVSVPNAEENYTYKWSNGEETQDLQDLESGDYSVEIIENGDCIYKKTLTVELDNDIPRVQIVNDGIRYKCEGDNSPVTISASASDCEGCQYIWSNGSITKDIDVESGDYNVRVIDENGCFAEDEGKVLFFYDDCQNPDMHIEVITPQDPNDIIGPAGVSYRRWVSVNDVLPYTIRFENDPEKASAPAVKVIIKTKIDDNADMYSFKLKNFGFGDFFFEVPYNSSHYTDRLDVVDSLGVVVDITAGLDVVAREAFWIFESKDPATGLPPADPNLGFLLVNDSITHRGEGFVSYSIKPRKNSHTGDSIKAVADIVFDSNESMLTPETFNTIDAYPPTSTVKLLSSAVDTLMQISLDAEDDFIYGGGGSGVADYDIYLSLDSGVTFNVIASKLPVDSVFEYVSEMGNTYDIYTISRDSVGNTELKDNSDIVYKMQSIYLTDPVASGLYCTEDTMLIKWENASVNYVNLLYSADGGATYSSIVSDIPADDLSYPWFISSDMPQSSQYLIKIEDFFNDSIYDISDTMFTIYNTIPVEITSSKGTDICNGDYTVLDAGEGFETYLWSAEAYEQVLNAYEGGSYFVEVTDQNGCKSSDTISISLHTILLSCQDTIIVNTDNSAGYFVSGNEFDSQILDDYCGLTSLTNDINDTTSLSGAFLPLGANIVTWTAKDSFENVSVCSSVILVNNSTEVSELQEKSHIKIYPNPTRGKVSIELYDNKVESIELVDIEGKILSVKKSGFESNEIIDLSEYTNGTYIIYIKLDKNTIITRSIVKEN